MDHWNDLIVKTVFNEVETDLIIYNVYTLKEKAKACGHRADHHLFPLSVLTIDAAVALWMGKVGCRVLSHRYSLTGYKQLGSDVYQVGVPLSICQYEAIF